MNTNWIYQGSPINVLQTLRVGLDEGTNVIIEEKIIPEEFTSELKWYYGPTEWDDEPGKMWHKDCDRDLDGEVLFIDGGHVCTKCRQQDQLATDFKWTSVTDNETRRYATEDALRQLEKRLTMARGTKR